LRHQPEFAEKQVALIDDQEAKAVIVQLNRAAEEVGVRCGMTPSQGLARSLQLIVKTRLRAQEKALEDLLLQFGFSLAPYVEATAPGICTVQFTDFRHVRRSVERVVEQLREANLTAQAGIAQTPETSFLAAYLARPVLEVSATKDFLAPLPIETLAIG
jgi:hypothetical protein